jgi:hypothetical protein
MIEAALRSMGRTLKSYRRVRAQIMLESCRKINRGTRQQLRTLKLGFITLLSLPPSLFLRGFPFLEYIDNIGSTLHFKTKIFRSTAFII